MFRIVWTPNLNGVVCLARVALATNEPLANFYQAGAARARPSKIRTSSPRVQPTNIPSPAFASLETDLHLRRWLRIAREERFTIAVSICHPR